MKNRSIDKFMTKSPRTINSGVSIQVAKEMMKRLRVRHLPVRLAGHLVGVVSERDLKVASAFPGSEQLLVDDVMIPDPFAVMPSATLGRVVEELAKRKIGCAIVQEPLGKVVGIFTTADALNAFSSCLRADAHISPRQAKRIAV